MISEHVDVDLIVAAVIVIVLVLGHRDFLREIPVEGMPCVLW